MENPRKTQKSKASHNNIMIKASKVMADGGDSVAVHAKIPTLCPKQNLGGDPAKGAVASGFLVKR